MPFQDQTDEILHRSVEDSQAGDIPVCSVCGDEIGDPEEETWFNDELYCPDCLTHCCDCSRKVPEGQEAAQGWRKDALEWYCPDCQEGLLPG